MEVGQGYRGKLTQAGRHLGMDSLAGTVDLAGKVSRRCSCRIPVQFM